MFWFISLWLLFSMSLTIIFDFLNQNNNILVLLIITNAMLLVHYKMAVSKPTS